MAAVRALGAAMTIVGLALLLYAIGYGAVNKSIGAQIPYEIDTSAAIVVTDTVTVTVDGTTTASTIVVTLNGAPKITKNPAWMDTTTWAAIIGWFLVLTGPALWQGEVPAAIKRRLEEARGR